uniref:hypothetical protein n=1 Tax=Streptomyces sp. NBC_01001 TaxID=2903713 RepID=UPI002F914943
MPIHEPSRSCLGSWSSPSTLTVILHYTDHALRHSSGAYRLVSTCRAHPFDDVFGSAAARAA